MERVAFITCEYQDIDLIVSYAVQDPDDPVDVDSLTLMRTPQFEPLKPEHERGVHVTFSSQPYADTDDMLLSVEFDPTELVVLIKTQQHSYDLDLSKVDPEEIHLMRRVFKLMNFDSSFRAVGVDQDDKAAGD